MRARMRVCARQARSLMVLRHRITCCAGVSAYARCCPALFANAYAMLRRRVGYLMALDLFSDWPAQDLAFFARWMTELELRMMVRQRTRAACHGEVSDEALNASVPTSTGRPHVRRG